MSIEFTLKCYLDQKNTGVDVELESVRNMSQNLLDNVDSMSADEDSRNTLR